jgi:hypothetical protein
MNRTIREMTSLLRTSLIAALFGGLAAVVGLAIEGRNINYHGAEYSSYQFDWLTLGALPGMMITEARFGLDFQLGEIMQYRSDVIGWNALIYAILGTVLYGFFRLIRRPTTTVNPAKTNLPNKAQHPTA